MKAYEEFRRDDLNATSHTAAQGWMGLFNGFAGKDDPKGDSRDLLPYPQSARDGEVESKIFSTKTANMIAKLIEDKSIAGVALVAIGSVPQADRVRRSGRGDPLAVATDGQR